MGRLRTKAALVSDCGFLRSAGFDAYWPTTPIRGWVLQGSAKARPLAQKKLTVLSDISNCALTARLPYPRSAIGRSDRGYGPERHRCNGSESMFDETPPD